MGCCPTIRIFSSSLTEEPIYKVNVKAVTWLKDTNNLFDYESDYVSKKSFEINQTGILYRNGNEIVYRTQDETLKPEKDQTSTNLPENLVHMNFEEGFITQHRDDLTNTPNEKQIDSNPWFIAKSLNSERGVKGYRLEIDDIIRFGRVKFKVIRLEPLPMNSSDALNSTGLKKASPSKNDINNIPSPIGINLTSSRELIKIDFNLIKKMADENLACRICLIDASDIDYNNPIIQPCKCTGTMKYVHLECFKTWIKKQVYTKSSSNLMSFYWKKLQCELCKDQIQNEFIYAGQKINLIDIPKIDQTNIVLESYMNDKSKGFHIIKFSQKQPKISLGRGTACDIRINDMSVSRQHASIKLQKGKFYLQDCSSKFGTLILMRENSLAFSKHKELNFQIGKTILELKIIKHSRPISKPKKNQKIHPQAPNVIPIEMVNPQIINLNQHESFPPSTCAKPLLGTSNNGFDFMSPSDPHKSFTDHNQANNANSNDNAGPPRDNINNSLCDSRPDEEPQSVFPSVAQNNEFEVINLEEGNVAMQSKQPL